VHNRSLFVIVPERTKNTGNLNEGKDEGTSLLFYRALYGQSSAS
jgi:hypothetical protein